MSGLSHRKDVQFLEECNPALVERNAAEFKRLRNLLVQVEEPARRAETGTEWHSDGSHAFTSRLSEARQLVQHIAEGYDKAASALHAYAAALTTAKSHYANGKGSERKLAALIATKGTAITRTAQEAEPMCQWEDMRATTGFLDGLAELTMDVDDIRDEANRLHDDAGGNFQLAKTTEQEARSSCVHALKQAYELLPEFRLKGGASGVDLYAAMADMRREAAEARANPLTQLPGSGPKKDMTGPVGPDTPISPQLRDIRLRVAGLPGDAADNYWIPLVTDGQHADWISQNKEVLRAAAKNAGLPEELVAGVAWQEIGGYQPGLLDDVTGTIREQAAAPWGLSPVTPENLPWRLGGKLDETSYGPIAIQLRRGAEVLGYDPANLTDHQRTLVEEALQDPKQNAFIAAGFLAQIKAESGLADVPADQMTEAQMREIAARYNGGPYWDLPKAQGYGDRFVGNLAQAKDAMR
ncbi:hypothetical protein OG594_25815 [Streptomyces sp. NBC_01214]|uniref:hypothetical protein n=1 Tax=Streptomyces sp. NBC_01214 TaxID=2903777 RepID=UPI00224FB308|nr:hypothetical protein [Streptomyces sp. NBC_01214]MCX4804984.1 hypothetical protein [Streptomyces sp. NBC_01214]